ncbi:MAG: DUF262 domain-containing protein, partial [Chitinophagaceae bacterium]
MQQSQFKTSVVSIGSLLQYSQLHIPVYQRPYKWSQKNVAQLIKDMYTFRSKSAYRFGTVVIHDDGSKYNIVDGQQRIITLLLLVQAIVRHHSANIKNPELKSLLCTLNETMFTPGFSNDISIANISSNYQLIEREVITFDEDLIMFLLNRCEVIQFVLNDVSEAFQFFDAQNARGRDLEPHDLLKAFHLREFSERDEPQKTQVVDAWEQMQTDELSGLFADFLFRVRGWSRLQSARYFTKGETELFKGVNIDRLDAFAYAIPLRIAHRFVDNYNNNFERQVDMQQMTYPFQLDQPIINGRRFFEMVAYYKKTYDTYQQQANSLQAVLNAVSLDILNVLNTYDGRHRIGDTYVRMLFDCALLFYIDRFGYNDINKAVEKIFIWAYSVRLNY